MANATAKTESAKLVKAQARDLRIAPRKMRLVTNLLKGMQVEDAMVQLQHLNKKGAPMVAKLLKSAVANAKNNFSMDEGRLYIKSITADMGQAMKRYFPRARGSAFVIRRKLSHVNIVLEERKGKAAGKSRFKLFESKAKPAAETAAPEGQTPKAPKELGRKSEVPKSEEQVKMNKVQNKRRLFNRKSGE